MGGTRSENRLRRVMSLVVSVGEESKDVPLSRRQPLEARILGCFAVAPAEQGCDTLYAGDELALVERLHDVIVRAVVGVALVEGLHDVIDVPVEPR